MDRILAGMWQALKEQMVEDFSIFGLFALVILVLCIILVLLLRRRTTPQVGLSKIRSADTLLPLDPEPRLEANAPAEPDKEEAKPLPQAASPLVEPLGLNWKSGVAILSGISAKEIVVSTLGVLYSNDAGTTETSLSQTLRESGDFTPASALAFLVFSLIYFPCIATVAAVRSEAGRGWACATMLYNTVVAWLMAWGVYHLALIL